jgi:hypothetical protein
MADDETKALVRALGMARPGVALGETEYRKGR